VIHSALRGHVEEVRGGVFPGEEQTVHMDPGERERLKRLLRRGGGVG